MKNILRSVPVLVTVTALSVLVCVAFGCLYPSCATKKTSAKNTDFEFLLQTNSCFVDELALVWTNRNDAKLFFACMGVDSNQWANILDDPFHHQQYVRIEFAFSCNVERIIKWCDDSMENNGWVLVRNMLITEETNGGGDWVHVYRRASALARIHIIGPRESYSIPINGEGWQPIHRLQIDLINIIKETFLEEFGGGLLSPKIPTSCSI
jgi:hypothetical protein